MLLKVPQINQPDAADGFADVYFALIIVLAEAVAGGRSVRVRRGLPQPLNEVPMPVDEYEDMLVVSAVADLAAAAESQAKVVNNRPVCKELLLGKI